MLHIKIDDIISDICQLQVDVDHEEMSLWAVATRLNRIIKQLQHLKTTIKN